MHRIWYQNGIENTCSDKLHIHNLLFSSFLDCSHTKMLQKVANQCKNAKIAHFWSGTSRECRNGPIQTKKLIGPFDILMYIHTVSYLCHSHFGLFWQPRVLILS